MSEPSYGMSVTLEGVEIDEAQERVTAALAEQGFGVLTEIDVKATLKKKLDEDFRPYRILGACNPKLAHRALQTDGHVGLLLPCNVVVQEEDGDTVVSIIAPQAMFQVMEGDDIQGVVEEADQRLRKVVDALS